MLVQILLQSNCVLRGAQLRKQCVKLIIKTGAVDQVAQSLNMNMIQNKLTVKAVLSRLGSSSPDLLSYALETWLLHHLHRRPPRRAEFQLLGRLWVR